MATEVFIPKMTDHMETALLTRWLVQAGQPVERGQAILEVETDKAIAEVEAPASGILVDIRAEEGQEVPVGQVVAMIVQPDEAAPASAAAPAKAATEAADHTVRATPVARRVAKEMGIDLRLVTGSGPGGRIREEDVQAFAQAKPVAASTPVRRGQDSSSASVAAPASEGWVELTRTQLITGRRMIESVHTAPHFTLTVAADVTETLRWQAGMAQHILEATSEKLSWTTILVKVCAAALRRHPRANVSFEEGRLRLHSQINVGVAIGAEDGLVVPVIKNADQKSLADLVMELRHFRIKAQEKRLSPDELSGGTFTLSNLGMYGVDQFTAILNPPESAILAVGRVKKTPVVLSDDTVVARPLMVLTLSIDHRSLDGVHGAHLLDGIKKLLEQPFHLL